MLSYSPSSFASRVGTAVGPDGTLNHHYPVMAYCPQCGRQVRTKVRISYSKCAHISAALCVLFGCILGCCLLPYFSMCYIATKHYCPQCDLHLGSYNSCLERFY